MSRMKKEFGEYYLGLDIGTDSVGWAVTDLNYKLLKLNRKALWGVRLFESGNTAAERRTFRAARRRLQRRNERIRILQELFAEEISKVDMGFYQRLQDSKYWHDDKKEDQKNSLFHDLGFDDKTYHDTYKTIYHLRKDLIENTAPHDVRLVYLAIHHILKHRGHFLFEGDDMDSFASIHDTLHLLEQHLKDEYDADIVFDDMVEIENILKNRELTITNKKKKLAMCISIDLDHKKLLSGIINLISGGTESINNLYMDDSLKDAEISKISFTNYDDIQDKLEEILGERYFLLNLLKAIYDWSIFSTILNGHAFLSEAKVAVYEEHREDLRLLKKVVRQYCPEEYAEIFRSEKEKVNYSAYVGISKNNGAKNRPDKTCVQADLLKYLANKLKGIQTDDPDYQYVMERIENGTFLPKQVNSDNGVIPNQVHKKELKLILKNAENYLPFLTCIDDTGYSVSEKIIQLFEFRIPYYVGPLNDSHKSDDSRQCWVVRTPGKIYPWNFEEKVDVEESASNFITRMTNKCTYLIGEDVLPKQSLLYSQFMVLNELNNLKINGEPISVELKQKIFNEKFMLGKKVTGKSLKIYLKKEGIIEESDELSGFDIDFKSTLASQRDFNRILKDKAGNTDMVEEIIKWIVLFGDDKRLLKSRITRAYGSLLDDEQVKEILKLKYSGWGRLSKKMLKGIMHIDKTTGEASSIITMMWNTNDNLMELLTDRYDYLGQIKLHNDEQQDTTTLSYDAVEKLYVSPSVKRSIWQTITIVKELEHIMGHPPKKVFVEMARSHEESKRTESRKNQLLALYKNCKDESRDWYNEINDKWSDSDLRSKKLYLYYTQMGRCMYTGKAISLDELFNKDMYDIDHIYPRSKVKDDSILNNLVLVDKRYNSSKTDIYPLAGDIREKNKGFWYLLKEKELITPEKYKRLIRNSEFTTEELGGFIARQIVETSQSTKAVAEILKKVFPDTGIVYVKAKNVSDFRQENNFVKVREINDYHHAKDAYLNIVVGNVYDSKFTRNPIHFLKEHPTYKYSLNRMYDYNVTDIDGTVAWNADGHTSMKQVESVMRKNNILFTRYAHERKHGQSGGFFDQNPLKKGQGQIPLKAGMQIDRYGGYNGPTAAYLMYVEHTRKGKRIRTFEPILLLYKKMYEEKESNREKYCMEVLGLVEPNVLLDKIKIDALFYIDGFYMHLSGCNERQVLFKCATQLCVSPEEEIYIKKIIKYCERVKKEKREIKLPNADIICKERNLLIYDMLTDKIRSTIYNVRLSSQLKTLEPGRERFLHLAEEEQCKVIYQMLMLFACNSMTANLTQIGGGANVGKLQINKNIEKYKEFTIINQSPTGIFEEKIDLLTL